MQFFFFQIVEIFYCVVLQELNYCIKTVEKKITLEMSQLAHVDKSMHALKICYVVRRVGDRSLLGERVVEWKGG